MILKKNIYFSIMIGIFLLTGGCSGQSENGNTSASENSGTTNSSAEAANSSNNPAVTQINGIGYPGNDHVLYVATNNGLKFFGESKKLKDSAQHHDFSSFQAIDTGFLASGHPEKGTGYKDPLGLVESLDKGKSLKPINFYGESNFHFLAASFYGGGVYMINEKPAGKLVQGVYYSKDNGKIWRKSELANFTSDSLGVIAVHAKKSNIMAIATRSGIFYSEDYGNSMKAITGSAMITALTFAGDEIVYSSVEEQKILLKKVNPKTGEQTNIIFPFLDYDNAVTYLAVDPKNENKLAFSTYKNDLYESLDGGKNWNNLISDGRIEQE